MGRALVAVNKRGPVKAVVDGNSNLKLSLLMKSNSVQSYRADRLRIQP
ncbi:hypothetical protein PBI_MINILON_58 [Mycobacterium phage MiniLon]|nr:hypothetical protein PBI_MINILON_58 [Mycobacterium phage MiniLon]QOP66529.1 hypothetical protein PBI_MINIMAC_58 [Mycobacterium phage MiniMac]